jgi:transcriptional regulator with XRE-family HTH domain
MCELKVKEIRKKLNISQEELAENLGVHRNTVQKWETGGTIPNTKRSILYKLLSEEPLPTPDPQPTALSPQPDERLSEPSADYSASANREIRLLRQHIIALERTIRDKEEIIRLLKQKL